MDLNKLLPLLAITLMVLILIFVLLQAKSKRGKQRILNLEAGKLATEEGWEVFQWVVSQTPERFYAVPAVRLVDAFPALAPGREKIIGKLFSLIGPYSRIILDAVIVDLRSGLVVAVVQRNMGRYDMQLKQVVFDAGIPLIEADLKKKIPWDVLNLSA